MSAAVLDHAAPDSTWYVSKPLAVGNIIALLVRGTGDSLRDALPCPGGPCQHSVMLRTPRGDYVHPTTLDSYTVFALKKHLHAAFEDERLFRHLVKCHDSFANAGIVDADRMRFVEQLCDVAETQFGFTPRPQLTQTERALIHRLRQNTPWNVSATLSNIYHATRSHILEMFGPSPALPTVCDSVPDDDRVELPRPDDSSAQLLGVDAAVVDNPIVQLSADNGADSNAQQPPNVVVRAKRTRKPVERYKPQRSAVPRGCITK